MPASLGGFGNLLDWLVEESHGSFPGLSKISYLVRYLLFILVFVSYFAYIIFSIFSCLNTTILWTKGESASKFYPVYVEKVKTELEVDRDALVELRDKVNNKHSKEHDKDDHQQEETVKELENRMKQ